MSTTQTQVASGQNPAPQLFGWAMAMFWLETALIAGVAAAPHLGVDFHWTAQTTPYRLQQRPDLAWALVGLLTLGLLGLRWAAPGLVRCVCALLFGGMVCGVALVSMWAWDPWLGVPLVAASNMLVTACVQGLRGLLAPLR